MKKNIVLIGFMGTGKSTVGRILSRRLNMNYLDTDTTVEERKNLKVSDIFKKYGEEYFRKEEAEVVKLVSEKYNTVISTGGGIVVNPDNIKYLSKRGSLFLLSGEIDTIIKNVQKSLTERPLLAEGNPRQKVIEILDRRKNLYSQYADYTIKIDNKKPDEVADEIIYTYKCLILRSDFLNGYDT